MKNFFEEPTVDIVRICDIITDDNELEKGSITDWG